MACDRLLLLVATFSALSVMVFFIARTNIRVRRERRALTPKQLAEDDNDTKEQMFIW